MEPLNDLILGPGWGNELNDYFMCRHQEDWLPDEIYAIILKNCRNAEGNLRELKS